MSTLASHIQIVYDVYYYHLKEKRNITTQYSKKLGTWSSDPTLQTLYHILKLSTIKSMFIRIGDDVTSSVSTFSKALGGSLAVLQYSIIVNGTWLVQLNKNGPQCS